MSQLSKRVTEILLTAVFAVVALGTHMASALAVSYTHLRAHET